MKKRYISPAAVLSVANFDTLCIGVAGSTNATEGNLAKLREDEQEEDEAIIQLLKDTEEGNTSALW
jgi:hypothetical protein